MKKKFDEKLWIQHLQKKLPQKYNAIHQGLKDDLAHLRINSPHVLWSSDMLMENVDFLLKKNSDFFWAGYKAITVNLSDLAGKCCDKIIGCLISISWPRHYDFEKAQFFLNGMIQASKKFNCPILGGDTNVWSQDLCISVSILGTKNKPAPKCGDAKTGDYLLVTGPLGGSIYGRHLRFTPRLDLSKYLFKNFPIHAMTDISDGLAAEVKKICKASKLGAVIFESKIPIHPITKKKHSNFEDQLKHAFCDGEDFELLFSVTKEVGEKIIRLSKKNKSLKAISHIGVLHKTKKIFLENRSGIKKELTWDGFIHS